MKIYGNKKDLENIKRVMERRTLWQKMLNLFNKHEYIDIEEKEFIKAIYIDDNGHIRKV